MHFGSILLAGVGPVELCIRAPEYYLILAESEFFTLIYEQHIKKNKAPFPMIFGVLVWILKRGSFNSHYLCLPVLTNKQGSYKSCLDIIMRLQYTLSATHN